MDKESGQFYFPAGWWCPVFEDYLCIKGPVNMTFDQHAYLLHLREGYILPWQNNDTFKTIVDTQNANVDFLINPTEKFDA